MPGTEPNLHSFRDATGDAEADRLIIQDACKKHHGCGMTYLRVTVVGADFLTLRDGEEPRGYWIEGWYSRPDEEASFNPPLALPATEDGPEHLKDPNDWYFTEYEN